MNTYLIKLMLFGGMPRKNISPQKEGILDLSDEAILLIFKHLGTKEELASSDLCNASGAFSLAMTCTRFRKIFQRVVRKIDAREPCTTRRGNNRCTCRSSHELQFKAWISGPTLVSIKLPRVTFRSINSVLQFYARFCPNVSEIAFHDGELLEKFTTSYLCNRLKMQSITVSNPSKRFLETLQRSRSRFTKLVLTDIKPECVPAVRDVIRSRGSTLKVLIVSISLEGLWSQLDGLVAVDILCDMLTAAADEVVETRERYGPPIEIFEISGSPIRTKHFEKGVTKKIYLPSGKRSIVNPIQLPGPKIN